MTSLLRHKAILRSVSMGEFSRSLWNHMKLSQDFKHFWPPGNVYLLIPLVLFSESVLIFVWKNLSPFSFLSLFLSQYLFKTESSHFTSTLFREKVKEQHRGRKEPCYCPTASQGPRVPGLEEHEIIRLQGY